MNIDTKINNTILADRIQQRINKIIDYIKWDLSQEMKGYFHIHKFN